MVSQPKAYINPSFERNPSMGQGINIGKPILESNNKAGKFKSSMIVASDFLNQKKKN
jgi:hypothetical protein